MIVGDHHLTIWEVVEHVRLSCGCAQIFISDGKDCWKVSAKWDTRLLTEERKANRFTVCERLLTQYWAEGDDLLRFIVICDDMWVHHYTRELCKHVGRNPGEAELWMCAKICLSAGKVVDTFYGIVEAVCLLIFFMTCKQLMLHTTANCLVKWSWLFNLENARDDLLKVWFCSMKILGHTQQYWPEKDLDKFFWKTRIFTLSSDLWPCKSNMFAPYKEEFCRPPCWWRWNYGLDQTNLILWWRN